MGLFRPVLACGLMAVLTVSGGCTTDGGSGSTNLSSTAVPSSSAPSEVVTVPNGVGATIASATALMADSGLRVEAASAQSTEIVVSQRPEAGSRVAVGSTITLEARAVSGASTSSPDSASSARL